MSKIGTLVSLAAGPEGFAAKELGKFAAKEFGAFAAKEIGKAAIGHGVKSLLSPKDANHEQTPGLQDDLKSLNALGLQALPVATS